LGQASVWNSGWMENCWKKAWSLRGSKSSPYNSPRSPHPPRCRRRSEGEWCNPVHNVLPRLSVSCLLLQWRYLLRRTTILNQIPGREKLILVEVEPFKDQAECPLREIPMYDSALNVHGDLVLSLDGMEVRRRMIPREDPDCYAKESRYLRHTSVVLRDFHLMSVSGRYFSKISAQKHTFLPQRIPLRGTDLPGSRRSCVRIRLP
jgi:hypothetical protein